jgi:hypothetical protein
VESEVQPNKVPHVYMGFEKSFEPFQQMRSRAVDLSANNNGCLDDVAWNEYYVYDVCVATTCDLSDFAIERTTEQARTDKHSLRFLLKPTPLDKWPIGEATHRAELRPNSLSPVNRYPQDDEERWYGFSVFFPDDFVIVPTALASDLRFSIAQWQHGSEGSPAVALEVYGNKIAVARAEGTSLETEWVDPEFVATVTPGEWLDLVIQIKWSRQHGKIALWANGKPTYEREGVQTMYRDLSVGGGFKVGLYYWRWQYQKSVQDALDIGITQREIFIDEIREYLGSEGYSAVAAGNSF